MNDKTEDNRAFSTDGELPAYPTADRGDGFSHPGMTLRDYFAAQALVAMPGLDTGDSPEHIARQAYRIADAMVKERGGW